MEVKVELVAAEWLARAKELKADGWLLASISGLDRMHLGFEHRFGIVAHLVHMERKERQSIHIAATGEPPTVPSVTPLWAGANFFEREAYDLFGIRFEGHPALKRILMPDEWEGHPLRKDYSVGKVPVDFLNQPLLQINAPGQAPSAGEALQDTDHLGQPAAPERRGEG